ncbi:MAG: hypothetical protein ABSB15_08810 [Bryobacteraceae bacterium]|jgi:hypothetical protein
MTWATTGAIGLVIMLSAGPAWAAEPLLGRWLLVSQEIGGQKTEVDELTLRVVPAGQTIEFAYSVPVNNIQFVSLRFVARPDGTEAEVTNANGQKIGTVKVTRSGASQYRVVLQGQNKPTASGTMTVSADGKTLTSESESKQPGQSAVTRMVQVFARQ